MTNSEILLYQTENGQTKIDVRLEEELEKKSSLRKIGISDFSTKPSNFFNLDVIISVGYRVKSHQGTKFHQLTKFCKFAYAQ